MPRHRMVEKWSDIVRELDLDLSQWVSSVTAADIDRITGEQPRLMASMDKRMRLPEVFQNRGVFLLPVSGRAYVIVRGEGYHDLEDIDSEPQRFRARFPFDLTTLAFGAGENRYLRHADAAGVLNYFSGIRELYATVSGKMRTGAFEFRVDGSPDIHVDGAQIEIDAGYEGRDNVLLFEAKADRRRSFIIRQLYFPFRTIEKTTPKEVRSFFFHADKKTKAYSLWEYRFEDLADYESIKLVKAARFVIEITEPPLEVLESVEPNPKLDIVPQANDFQKVADFPLRVYSGIVTAKQWGEAYGIDPRQGNYYREAAGAMGLVRYEEGRYALTAEGRRYVKMEPQGRGDFLAPRILRIPLMNRVYHMVRARPERGLGREEIAALIERTSHLSGTTPNRRASSVLSFFKWLARTTGAVVIKNRRIYPRPTPLESFRR